MEKENLFGRVLTQATGPHAPDRVWLESPLEREGSIAHCFCRGCSLSSEVDKEHASELAALAGVSFQDGVPKGIYFETAGCPYCDGDQSRVEVKNL